MKVPVPVNPRNLYRLPWTLPDNAISWLEPTSACNFSCDGCYRENVKESHKSLDTIEEELKIFQNMRNSDGVSIAGGDPLLHPEIVEIVRIISDKGFKPIINTNGALLKKDLLLELKKSGVAGFTIHIDSKQNRPNWKNKNEVELNELRLQFAEMLAEVGGIACSFNSTVYEDTLQFTPDLIKWAGKNIDIVQTMVFILYRAAVPQLPFDWYIRDKKVDMSILVYSENKERKIDLKSTDVVSEIRKKIPDFTPCAFLNGTEKPDSYKWLLSGRIGTKEKIFGYVGPKFMEIMQTMHHLGTGKYLAYTKPSLTSKGKSMLLLSSFDKNTRSIALNYLKSVLANPIRFFKGMYFQSIMIIQPVDFLDNGYQNMCDGCPDMTVWNGELVWSCRLEELKQFGCWARTVPRSI